MLPIPKNQKCESNSQCNYKPRWLVTKKTYAIWCCGYHAQIELIDTATLKVER